MTKDYDRKMKLKNDSEKFFREKCDENNYTYMYIDQEKMTFSSKIWKDMTKRPDYILSIPHIGSIFVDVKAYKEYIFYKDYFENQGISPPKAFTFDLDEIHKYLRLQTETSMKVWFAIMSVQDDTVTNEVHFLPVDRVKDFMSPEHSGNWKYVQVPFNCYTDCSRLAHNACGKCNHKYCKDIKKITEIDKKAHLQKNS